MTQEGVCNSPMEYVAELKFDLRHSGSEAEVCELMAQGTIENTDGHCVSEDGYWAKRSCLF